MTLADHELDQAEDRLRPDEAGSESAGANDRPPLHGLVAQLQRRAGNAAVADYFSADAPTVERVIRGGGQALDSDVGARVGQVLGQDFSGVRVHTDGAAASSAAGLSATAYTVGDDIVFSAGAYAPGTEAGRRTLAHELTHVAQQRAGPVSGEPTAGGLLVSDPHSQEEQAADHVAEGFAAGVSVEHEHLDFQPTVGNHAASGPIQVQRKTVESVPAPVPLEVSASSLEAAADEIAKDIQGVEGDVIIVGVAPDSIRIFDKDAKPITGTIPLTMKEGITFSPGVFYTQGGVTRRVYYRPDTKEWVLGEFGGMVIDKKPKADKGQAAPQAKSDKDTKTSDAKEAPPQIHSVAEFIKDTDALTPVLVAHAHAAEYYVVPSHTGSGKNKAGKETTGFAGELEGGDGPVPNDPPWPSKLTGAAMQPFGGTGTYTMSLDFSAYGNNTTISEVITRVGSQVHYRWELFDVTHAAQQMAGSDVGGAGAAKAAINDQHKMDEIKEEARTSKPGTGESSGDVDAAGRAAGDKLGDWADDTKQAAVDLWNLTGDTVWEKTSNAMANYESLALTEVSALAALASGGLRIIGDLVGGRQDEHEIPWPKEELAGGKVYVVRCVAQPASAVDPKGVEHIYAASTAAMVVQVSNIDRLVRKAMGEGDDQLGKKQVEILAAERKGDEQEVKKLQAEEKEMETLLKGFAADVIVLQIQKKQEKLDALKEEASHLTNGEDTPGYGSRIRALQNDIDDLQARLVLAVRQEQARTGGDKSLGAATRINANLVSGVTGRTYPLLLSVGPKADEGGMKVWQVADDTGKEGDRYAGEGSTPSEALWHALEKFAGEATYGRGRIGIEIPESVPLEQGAQRERILDSRPRGWAIAKGRIDDLVQVLMMLGLLVPGAGEVGAVIAGALAASHLINSWQNDHLSLSDPSTISDVIGVLGGFTAFGEMVGGLILKELGDSAVVAARELDEEALTSARNAMKGVQDAREAIRAANAAIGYAGLVWTNVTTMNSLLAISDQEIEGAITHAEARRQRTQIIGQLIQNDGLALAGEYKKFQEGGVGGGHSGGEEGTGGEHEQTGTQTPDHADAAKSGEAKDDSPGGGGGGKGEPPGGGGSGGGGGRRSAFDALRDALAGGGDVHGAATDLILEMGNWKGSLKAAVRQLPSALQSRAAAALVDARAKLIDEAWATIKDKFPGIGYENVGTVSFTSDIDLTMRPESEATAAGEDMAAQIRACSDAARALLDALRARLGGRETDAVIDTNVYSFVGEGGLAAPGPTERAGVGDVERVVGFAEQLRGQGREAFGKFEREMLKKFEGDNSPEGRDAKAALEKLLADAQTFFNQRDAEARQAEADAKKAAPGASPEAIRRMAREAIVNAKKAQLADLSRGQPPDFEAIARVQAEIRWFEPDAYATASAFDQAVAHAQRLKGAAQAARGSSPADVVAALQEKAKQVEAQSPGSEAAKAAKAEADLAGAQAHLLDEARAEQQRAAGEDPVDTAWLDELAKRIAALEQLFAERATRQRVDDLMDQTMGHQLSPRERLVQASASASANAGMLSAHVEHALHAGDVDGALKAACKYGARITLAEMLAGVGGSSSKVEELLSDFTRSRWPVPEDVSVAAMRDMLLAFAPTVGEAGIVRDANGNPIGVTDTVKTAFIHNVEDFAGKAAARLQVLASTAPDQVANAAPALPPGSGPGPEPKDGAGPDGADKQEPLTNKSEGGGTAATPPGTGGGPAPEGPAGRVHVLLRTDATGGLLSNEHMTSTLLVDHPNFNAIIESLAPLAVEVVADPQLPGANADVKTIRVIGPDGASFTRTRIRYNPATCTPQHFHHEINHLADYLSGRLEMDQVTPGDEAAFDRARTQPFDELDDSARMPGRPATRMQNLLRTAVAEVMNHLRDIDEYATQGGGAGAERDPAMEGFRNIEEETIMREYLRPARSILTDRKLSEALRQQAAADLRAYVASNFPELPADFDRIYNRGKRGQSFWQCLGLADR